MTPFEIKLPNCRRGDTISGFSILGITSTDNNQIVTAIDLTNADVNMHFMNSGRVVFKKLGLGTGIVLNGTDGITISPFEINQTGIVFFDIQFTLMGAIKKTWFKGSFFIEDDITK